MSASIGGEIDEANKTAVERILAAEATLVDLKPAIKAIPGYKRDLITHAGPPIEWDRMVKVQRIAVLNAIRARVSPTRPIARSGSCGPARSGSSPTTTTGT